MEIPPGIHTVLVKYEQTSYMKFADSISVVSLLFLVLISVYLKYKRND
jgi:hypothetical protein